MVAHERPLYLQAGGMHWHPVLRCCTLVNCIWELGLSVSCLFYELLQMSAVCFVLSSAVRSGVRVYRSVVRMYSCCASRRTCSYRAGPPPLFATVSAQGCTVCLMVEPKLL